MNFLLPFGLLNIQSKVFSYVYSTSTCWSPEKKMPVLMDSSHLQDLMANYLPSPENILVGSLSGHFYSHNKWTLGRWNLEELFCHWRTPGVNLMGSPNNICHPCSLFIIIVHMPRARMSSVHDPSGLYTCIVGDSFSNCDHSILVQKTSECR